MPDDELKLLSRDDDFEDSDIPFRMRKNKKC